MKNSLFNILSFIWLVRYNITAKRFKPGNILYIDGAPNTIYLVLEVDYHITSESTVHVMNLRDRRRNWYSVMWFKAQDLTPFSELEKLLYLRD